MTSAFNILTSYPSSGPHPDYQYKLMLFGQFEGVWDVDIEFFDDDGNSIFHGPGEWAFAWVLDGRVLQDVLTFPDLHDPSAIAPGKRNIGTSLRHYDPKTDTWRVVWIGASSGNLCFLTAKEEGDDLLIERNEPGMSLLRWRFSDITETQFHWTGHFSNDEGKTWVLEQEMVATKRV
jgi:hypothetical protein